VVTVKFMKEQYRFVWQEALGYFSCVSKREVTVVVLVLETAETIWSVTPRKN